MPKALDLRVLQEKTWEVILLDGRVVHIYKPTQKIRYMMNDFQECTDAASQMVLVSDIVREILSHNREGVTPDLADYDLSIKLAVIRGYSQWLTELLSDPN